MDHDQPTWALNGSLVFSAAIVALITAIIVLVDPSRTSSPITWLVTAVLVLAGFALTKSCVLGALNQDATGRALAMAGLGVVCLYLVGHAVTFDDVRNSSRAGGGFVAPSSVHRADENGLRPCLEGGECGSNSERDYNGDGTIGDELDDADGDYVPNGVDASPADPTVQYEDDLQ